MREGVASVEHDRTLRLANELTEVIKGKFPQMVKKLNEDFTNVRVLHKEEGSWLGILRESHTIPVGNIQDVPYVVTVSFRETLKQSRMKKSQDPKKMTVVVLGAIDISAAPDPSVDDTVLPTSKVTLTIGRYADEKEVIGPAVLGIVPKVQNEQTLRDEPGGVSISVAFDNPADVPKHVLSLEEIAFSKDLELGDHALRGLNELLETAIEEVRK